MARPFTLQAQEAEETVSLRTVNPSNPPCLFPSRSCLHVRKIISCKYYIVKSWLFPFFCHSHWSYPEACILFHRLLRFLVFSLTANSLLLKLRIWKMLRIWNWFHAHHLGSSILFYCYLSYYFRMYSPVQIQASCLDCSRTVMLHQNKLKEYGHIAAFYLSSRWKYSFFYFINVFWSCFSLSKLLHSTSCSPPLFLSPSLLPPLSPLSKNKRC